QIHANESLISPMQPSRSDSTVQSLHFRAAEFCVVACLIAFVVGCQTQHHDSSQTASPPKSPGAENPKPVVAAALVQTNQPPADAKPASSNVPGVQFPKIDSERRAWFRIAAPNATNVSVGLPGGRSMSKGDDGVWTVAT